jgi:hypothetical protein
MFITYNLYIVINIYYIIKMTFQVSYDVSTFALGSYKFSR